MIALEVTSWNILIYVTWQSTVTCSLLYNVAYVSDLRKSQKHIYCYDSEML